MSEPMWHVVLQGKAQGPFPENAVQTMIKEGKVSHDAMVWNPTISIWTNWKEVPAFAQLISQIPQQNQPPQPPNSAPAVPLIEPLIKQAKSLLTPQVKDYLSFKQMITPRLVNFVFWVSAILCLLSGLGLMLLSLFSLKIEGIAIGFFLMLIGPIIIRVYCELLIVFFRMNETLIEISHALAEKNDDRKLNFRGINNFMARKAHRLFKVF